MVLDSTLAPSSTPGIRPVHRLAENTELIGEYQGSGFQEPRFLIRRSDGQVMQLPALLYRVAGSLDGRRNDGELAAELAAELDQDLTAEQFSFLVEEKLRPAGIIAADDEPDAAEPPAPVKSDPLLSPRGAVRSLRGDVDPRGVAGDARAREPQRADREGLALGAGDVLTCHPDRRRRRRVVEADPQRAASTARYVVTSR